MYENEKTVTKILKEPMYFLGYICLIAIASMYLLFVVGMPAVFFAAIATCTALLLAYINCSLQFSKYVNRLFLSPALQVVTYMYMLVTHFNRDLQDCKLLVVSAGIAPLTCFLFGVLSLVWDQLSPDSQFESRDYCLVASFLAAAILAPICVTIVVLSMGYPGVLLMCKLYDLLSSCFAY